MYIFSFSNPDGQSGTITIDSEWANSSPAKLSGDDAAIQDIQAYFKRFGMTPEGRIADFPNIEPMSVVRTLTQAANEGYTYEVKEGELKPYPSDQDGSDSAMDSLSPTVHVKGKRLPTLMDRYQVQGLPISVENKAGTARAGVDPDGHKWETKMHHDYGYIRSTTGKDDEAIDVYVGPNRKAPNAYIVKQHKIEEVKKWGGDICPDCSEHANDCSCPQYYDEDKVMLGFDSKQDAIAAYLKQYDNPLFLGPVSTITVEDLKPLLLDQTAKGLPLQFKNALDNNSPEGSALDRNAQAETSPIINATTMSQLQKAFYEALGLDPLEAEHERLKSIIKNGSDVEKAYAVQTILAIGRPVVDAGSEVVIAGGQRHKDIRSTNTDDLVSLIPTDDPYKAESEALSSKLNEMWDAFAKTSFEESEKRQQAHQDYREFQVEYNEKKQAIAEKQMEHGQKVIDALLDESPITEEQSRAWADSVPIDKKTAQKLKRNGYPVEQVRADIAECYRITRGAMPMVSLVSTRSRRSSTLIFSGEIMVTGDFSKRILWHEMAHNIERNRIHQNTNARFLEERREGDKLHTMRSLSGNNRYGSDEVAIKDHLINPYMGKVYRDGITEVLPVAIEHLSDPGKAIEIVQKDEDSARYIFGFLRNISGLDREFSQLNEISLSKKAEEPDPQRDLMAMAKGLKFEKHPEVTDSNDPLNNRYASESFAGLFMTKYPGKRDYFISTRQVSNIRADTEGYAGNTKALGQLAILIYLLTQKGYDFGLKENSIRAASMWARYYGPLLEKKTRFKARIDLPKTGFKTPEEYEQLPFKNSEQPENGQ